MNKLCGLVVASVIILGLGSGPAAAASINSAPSVTAPSVTSASVASVELNRGGMICWLFPKRCK